MNCAGCGKPLARWEQAQPMMVLGMRVWPRSFCDECCRKVTWHGGNAASLDRLVKGETDPAEVTRVRQATDGWGLPFAAVLEQAEVASTAAGTLAEDAA